MPWKSSVCVCGSGDPGLVGRRPSSPCSVSIRRAAPAHQWVERVPRTEQGSGLSAFGWTRKCSLLAGVNPPGPSAPALVSWGCCTSPQTDTAHRCDLVECRPHSCTVRSAAEVLRGPLGPAHSWEAPRKSPFPASRGQTSHWLLPPFLWP